jgi:hypothetical protein
MTTIYKPTVIESIKLGSKTAPEIKRAIEMLGQLNDRHIAATGNRDKKALRELAVEYEAIKCPRLANEIRTEARAIRRTGSRIASDDGVISAAAPQMAVTT